MSTTKGPGCGPCPFPCEGCAVGAVLTKIDAATIIRSGRDGRPVPVWPPLKVAA